MKDYKILAQQIFDEADKSNPPYKKVRSVSSKPFEVAVERKGEIWAPRMKSTKIKKDVVVSLSVPHLLRTSTEYRHVAEMVEQILVESAIKEGLIRKEVLILGSPSEEEKMFYGFLPRLLFGEEEFNLKVTVTTNIGRSYVFSKGIGIRKALLKMGDMLNIDENIFQTLVDDLLQIKSKYNQRANISGTLVLSIDPIDFLTMSMNSSGWRSCYHLNGDRPIGASGLMQSPFTAIAYLETDNEFKFGDYTGPNKTWRTTIVFDGTHGYIGKHYPFYSLQLEEMLWDMLQETMPDMKFLLNTTVRSESDFIFDDVQNGYVPTTVFGKEESVDTVTLSMIKTIHCMKCGERMNKYEESLSEYGLVTCMECSNTSYCYECYDFKYGQGVGKDSCDDCLGFYEDEEEDEEDDE